MFKIIENTLNKLSFPVTIIGGVASMVAMVLAVLAMFGRGPWAY